MTPANALQVQVGMLKENHTRFSNLARFVNSTDRKNRIRITIPERLASSPAGAQVNSETDDLLYILNQSLE